jgi:hypothetical protein
MEPVIHQPRHKAHVLARWDDVVIDLFLYPPALRELKDIQDLYDHPDTPPHFGLMVVLTPSMHSAPEAEVRRAIHEQLHRYQSRIVAYATVVEMDGLLGTAARAVVNGMQMMEAWPFPVAVVESVPEAALFLCRHLPPRPGLSPGQVVHAVEQVRAQSRP